MLSRFSCLHQRLDVRRLGPARMDAVILAAGRGRRLRPLTDTRPKALLPIGGQTVLGRLCEQVTSHVERIIIVTDYLGQQIREQVGTAVAGTPVVYVEQPERRGTADAVAQVADVVEGPFVLLNGDMVVDPSFIEMLADGSGWALCVKEVDDPQRYGVVDVDPRGQLRAVIEKPADPPSALVNLGGYRFDATVFPYLEQVAMSSRGELELTGIFEPALAAGHSVAVERYDGLWYDIGTPPAYLAAVAGVLSRWEDSAIDATASVDPTVQITGRVAIGPRAQIGPMTYLRGPAVIGADVHLGHAVEVKASVIMADTAIPHLSYVGDSLIGSDVNLGAGTVIANLRHDDGAVTLGDGETQLTTDRRKLGAVIGDGVKTGINTSIMPGTRIGPHQTTLPGELIKGDLMGPGATD